MLSDYLFADLLQAVAAAKQSNFLQIVVRNVFKYQLDVAQFMLIFFTVQIFLYPKVNIQGTFTCTSFVTSRRQILLLVLTFYGGELCKDPVNFISF